MAKQCRTMLFAGRVQGVGFRYAACRVAAGHEVSGTVRNLPDGRVECIVEGEEAEVEAFLADLQGRMGVYIRGVTQHTAPYAGRHDRFTVSF